MKKIAILKKWFQNKITWMDLKTDLDGEYSFKACDFFEVEINRETEKALLIKLVNCNDSILNNKTLWVPKSCVEIKEVN